MAGEEIAISYAALADHFKISDFSMERYPNGILKSVNVTVDDRTADVASEAFKSIVSIGKIAIGLPPDVTTKDGAPPPQIAAYVACTDEARKALESLPGLRKTVRERDAAVKAATKAVADYVKEHSEEKPPADVVKETARLARVEREAQEALDAANKALAATQTKITLVSRFLFVPQQGISSQVDMLALADAETKPNALLTLHTRETLDDGTERWLRYPLGPRLTFDEVHGEQAEWVEPAKTNVEADKKLARDKAGFFWTIDGEARRDGVGTAIAKLAFADALVASGPLRANAVPSGMASATACGAEGSQRCGIIYRTQGPGRLRVCAAGADGALPDAVRCLGIATADARVLFTDERGVPQLGGLGSLGLTNRPFSNNILTAEFGEDGNLIKVGYKKPRAEAVAIGQSVNGGLDALSTLVAYERGWELRELGEEKALNDARAAAIASALPLQQPSEQTKIENATKLIEAERLRVEAQIELRKKQIELEALESTEEASGDGSE
ncbi:hypothetical protein [Novosphingobium indicum]|uniref:hypothetical protein n=1 Tax=Novosphingobium indicum TaxID=462949 RepID=UPI001668DD71|nr:hypothetical protein [Novosphingobium indicum]